MNIYEIVTRRILESLERGVIPWKKPWRSRLPQNIVTKKEYRGINSLLLNSLPFESPFYLTYRQAQSLGGNVRRAEKGFPVVFWNFVSDEKSDEKKKIPFLRYYTVFNISQCEGIEIPPTQQQQFNPIQECERIVAEMPNPPKINAQATYAAYSPSTDTVKMPARETFETPEAFYNTLYHELSHATGSSLRLNRPGITEDLAYGSTNYSKEELVAEISAAFLCAKAGIGQTTIENSASYVSGWLKALKNDKRMIISAAAHGQKAADYILNVKTSDEQDNQF